MAIQSPSVALPAGPPAQPDKAMRGAPDVAWHRNLTVALLALTTLLWSTGTVGWLTSSLHWSLVVLVNAAGTYIGFTVLHEAVHRTAHRSKRVNDALGWLPAMALFFSLSVFRTCHSKHHANTNDPEQDPDHSVARMPAFLRVWWLVFTIWNYRRLYYGRRWWRSKRELAVQILLDATLVVGIPIASLAGWGTDLLVLWVAPGLIAGMVLFYAFDYLPHHPHDSTQRYRDTRIQPGRIRHALLLGQNYHLVHHLWVTIPWYRYRQVFEELQDDLVARGARVD